MLGLSGKTPGTTCLSDSEKIVSAPVRATETRGLQGKWHSTCIRSSADTDGQIDMSPSQMRGLGDTHAPAHSTSYVSRCTPSLPEPYSSEDIRLYSPWIVAHPVSYCTSRAAQRGNSRSSVCVRTRRNQAQSRSNTLTPENGVVNPAKTGHDRRNPARASSHYQGTRVRSPTRRIRHIIAGCKSE